MIYGMEVNFVDDGVLIVYNVVYCLFEEEIYVVFDVEMMGLFVVYDIIIELVVVKVKGGEIIDKFEVFVNLYCLFLVIIIELIGIIDDMFCDVLDVVDVIRDFREWIGDDIFVVYNVSFDMGFLNVVYKKFFEVEKVKNLVIDMFEFGCFFYLEFKNYCLNIFCKKFDIEFI